MYNIAAQRRNVSYEEELERLPLASFRILLSQCDHLLGQPLRFLCFVPCGRDGLVLDEGGDEIAEERFAMA